MKLRPTNSALLQERIEKNYTDFKESVLQLDDESIFEYAPTIAAVGDVYSYLTVYDWANEREAKYLLQFENPLKMIADAWEEISESRGEEFTAVLAKITDGNAHEQAESYITVSLADELRKKYGDDMPIEAAIVCEIVELGRKLTTIDGVNGFELCIKGVSEVYI